MTFQMETPREFFSLPPGWTWEDEWEIEPLKGSLITEDFAVSEWADKRYEAVNYEDQDDILNFWLDKVSYNFTYL